MGWGVSLEFLGITEIQLDPMGLMGTKAPFPEFQRAGSVASQGREDAGTREEQSRNNSAALGAGPRSPSRDTHNSILELFCRY